MTHQPVLFCFGQCHFPMAAVMEAREAGCLAVRLTPGQDLKDELLKLMKGTTHTSA